MKDIINEKYEKLKDIIRSYGTLAVAFSGGVDSTFLLKVAHEVLGDKCLAVTVVSEVFPQIERNDSAAFCEKEGIRHIELKKSVFGIEGFSQNPTDRCYICKKSIFSEIKALSEREGFFIVSEGSNQDDEGDYRPGMRAIKELGIKSPLKEAGLTKNEIRQLSEAMGLPTWNKPSLACLATRIVYGETINQVKLSIIEEAEKFLRDKGMTQVRVRLHTGQNSVPEKSEDRTGGYHRENYLARIELSPEEMPELLKLRDSVTEKFRELGVTYVSMDLSGYRTGAMNEVFENQEKQV